MQFEKKISGFQFELKDTGDAMLISGYGSTFGGEPDGYNDIVAKGAYSRTLKTNGLPMMLWQHQSDEPIGKWTDAHEDSKGLMLNGQLGNTSRGRDAYELAKMGAIGSMSIGYSVRDAVRDQKTGVRTLKDLDLHEVSLVTFPANQNAVITAVKEAPTTIREFEAKLRDEFGLTHAQAKDVAARGWKAMEPARDEQETEPDDALLLGYTEFFKSFHSHP